MESIKCDSCGLPLDDSNKAPKNATKWQLCCYCVEDKTGELWPKEEIISGTAEHYFMGEQGMEEAVAKQAAEDMINNMPAWQDTD